MVVSTANIEEIIRIVDILAEIVVIHLINVTVIHIGLQKHVEDVLRGAHTELTESSQELVLGNMLVACNIEILEHWLQMNSLDSNCLFVLGKNTANHCFLLLGEVQVFAACLHSVINGNWSDLGQWVLLDAISCESSVNTGAEVFIVYHVLCIIRSFVFLSQSVVFFGREVEIEHGKDLFKLVFGNLASSELVEIEEELFNSYSLHDDGGLNTLFNIVGVVHGVYPLLHESVIDNVQALGFVLVERMSSISELSVHEHCIWFRVLSYVFWEDVLWLVNISTELEIVHFSNISLIKVLSKQKLIQFFGWWNDFKFLENAPELLGGNVAALSSVIVLELGLNEYTFEDDFAPDGTEKGKKGVFFGIIEVGSTL